jgi:hypothetical protein
VTNTELKAVDFLKKQPSKILITDPDLEIDKNSPYLTFLTRQKMYLSGIINELSAHDIDYKGNLKVRDRILQSKSPKVVAVQMRDNNIEYLYLLTSTKLAATASAGFLDPIYVNNQVKILKFNLEKARKYLK